MVFFIPLQKQNSKAMQINIIHRPKNLNSNPIWIFFKLLSTAKGRKHLWDSFWK
ncbi:MAG: hypothetical protein U5N85_15300 [Arcicella sp.]|nr:hypothetical protein [Arcicella sp.]